MTTTHEISLDDLDLTRWVRDGDVVMWGQSSGEPLPLTARLMSQRHAIGRIRAFIGLTESETLQPEHADVVSFVSYCGSAANRRLEQAGALTVLPSHYSDLARHLADGTFAVDVLFLMVTAEPGGGYRIAVTNEYLEAAIDRARVVIAELSDAFPRTGGARVLAPDNVDMVVRTSRTPLSVAPRGPSAAELAIADHIAALVPDGATLQFGLGSLPTAVLAGLTDRRDLGVHSGMLSDAVVALVEAGALTGRCKTVDRGLIVAGTLMGSQRLFDFVDGRPDVHLRGTAYTHDPAVLGAQHQLGAINSALEVDLTGQVNTEVALGRYLGAVGGVVDFIRGAHRSSGGLPIIALPSTAGIHSRIVSQLSGPVSMTRSDAGLIVTEHGIADLRGLTMPQRRERLLAIAHPQHRDRLDAEPSSATALPA
jgi:acetyl-CoA hydrolase